MKMSVAAKIASVAGARKRCLANGNSFADQHDETLDRIEREILPSGSGIDAGTKIDRERSGDEKVVLTTSFHHMNDAGYYCGWSDHTVIITPAFRGIHLKVTGRDVRGIKEYLEETFGYQLEEEREWDF